MNFLDIVYGTPLWVYAIFVYLISKGITALKQRSIPLLELMSIPAIFSIWSLYSLKSKYGLLLPIVVTWLLALLTGMAVGWIVFNRGINIDKKTRLVQIPGSWYPLFLYVASFIIKYYLGFTYTVWPEMQDNTFFWMLDVIASGIISGIFIGRLLPIAAHYRIVSVKH